MTTNYKKQLFPKEYAKELLQIAKGDLDSAIGLSKVNTGRPENIVILAQQSVEKSIKSVLVHLQIAFPLVHDLGILVALLPDDNMPPQRPVFIFYRYRSLFLHLQCCGLDLKFFPVCRLRRSNA
jgi:hypothetical protein